MTSKKIFLAISGSGDTFAWFRKDFFVELKNSGYRVIAMAPDISANNLEELNQAGIEVLWFTTGSAEAPQPYAYNHAKAVVLDDQEVWLGSGNFKDSSFPNRQQYEANGEVVLFIQNVSLFRRIKGFG